MTGIVDIRPDDGIDGIARVEHLERLRFRGDDGGWYAVIGLSTRFFVTDGHREKRRLDAIEAMRAYHARFRETLTHYVVDTGAARPLEEDEAFAFFRSKAGLARDDIKGLVLGLVGFPDREPGEQPLHNECRILMNMPFWASYYLYSDWTASLAFSVLPEPYHETLLACVLEWASILRPSHGTSGIGFLIDQDYDHGRISRMLHPRLMRHPGIDYDDGGNWAGIAKRHAKIRSINWLTVIDDAFLAQLGGAATVARALGAECPVHRYDGGAVIQAGPRPEIGDIEAGPAPEPYRKVARLLGPLRFEAYGIGLLDPPAPLDGVAETVRWIRRFD